MREPDQPGTHHVPGEESVSKKVPRKQAANASRAKGRGNTASNLGGAKRARATREDKGIPRLEKRDIIVLRWVMQMYLVRFDQLQVLLARHSPKRDELIDPEHVSPSTVRTHLRRWKALGLVRYRKILYEKEQPLFCWLTPYGLQYLAEADEDGDGIVYSYYEPNLRDLHHMYLIGQARLYVERYYPAYIFKSERQLKKEQQGRPKTIKKPHLTDGLFYRPDGKVNALEVERWDKASTRLRSILQELAQTYHRIWYFVGKKARTAVTKAHAQLPEPLGKRIQILSSEVKLLGLLPAKGGEQEGEVAEDEVQR